MRPFKSLYLLALLPLAGCGGDGDSIAPVDESQRAAVTRGTTYGIRLMEAGGNVEFGLSQQVVRTRAWGAAQFDSDRSLWSRSQLSQTADEGPDGVSTIYRSRLDTEFFTDQTMSTPAGTRLNLGVQDEYNHVETSDIAETLTQGPLAGYVFDYESSTSMSTSETTFTATATHPSWGEMKSTGFAGSYTTIWKQNGKEDKFVRDGEGNPLRVTLSNGTKMELFDGEGTVQDSSGKTLGTVKWSEGSATIHWTNGETNTFAIWPPAEG